MVPRGAFTVPLLLLVCAVSAITVPAPENVTLSCDNLKTTASWDYRDREPGTVFNVTIISSDRQPEWHITSELHFDLSSFVWASPQHYTAFHSVNVTAVRQGKSSKPVKSNSLSFNKFVTATVKCLLDFPPVNLTVDESGRTVSFENPFVFYEELRRDETPKDVSFKFNVSSNGSGPLVFVDCPLSQPKCKYDLSSSENVDECVVLNGYLNNLFTVDFRQTQPVCPTEPPEDHSVLVAVTLSVLLCVLAVAIGVIVKCIQKERARVKDTPTPRPLIVVRTTMGTYKLPREETSPLTCMPKEEGASRSSVSSGDLDEDSLKTDSVLIEEEEEEDRVMEMGHYDRGHVIDMGDEDMVQGYN